MKFFYYIFYRIFVYNGGKQDKSEGRWHALLVMSGIFFINFTTIALFILGAFNIEIPIYLSESRVFNRFIIAPIMLLPFGILFYFLFLNGEKTDKIIRLFRRETRAQARWGCFMVIMYVIISTILMILSIMTPTYFGYQVPRQ